MLVEILQVIQLLTAAATFLLLLYGIDSWRREHLGRRRMDMAEEALALFYEAKDHIESIRFSGSLGYEYEGVTQAEGESDDSFAARKQASIVYTRYESRKETFVKLYAMRYRFMAAFGPESGKPFDEMSRIPNEIKSAAWSLARMWSQKTFVNEQAYRQHEAIRLRHEAVFWDSQDEDDPINPQVKQVIADIEGICRPIIESQSTLYGLLNWRAFGRK